ncbi:hypothetical protein CAOG_07120 [Capsaspora owczarzaki ATCC 30864]|uniref:hypothetical protein n=1 Tax=Capsaspora owczarzaki (strain ATCC 30864) TaxID=595528 RepID=UPI0003524CAA|nr:hypothetical protein CAOG_07120 [Capsaspora owczarzaki ATCC 30864]|eukprot:XP_004343844.2 hypothetical protein CAOG_07120 [Capsaspora owczarzaki ATCC 30864]
MQALYTAIENRRFGIFESPTGTGKSMSIICGALTWLRDHEARQVRLGGSLIAAAQGRDQPVQPAGSVAPGVPSGASDAFRGAGGGAGRVVDDRLAASSSSSSSRMETTAAAAADEDNAEPDWVLDFAAKKAGENHERRIREEQELLLKQTERLAQVKRKLSQSKASVKRLAAGSEKPVSIPTAATGAAADSDGDEMDTLSDGEADLILSDYSPDKEQSDASDSDSDSEAGSGKFDARRKKKASAVRDDEDEEVPDVAKIYYCSRTHSQLNQFVQEVRKSPFGETTKVVVLGSRKNLCVNDDVRKLEAVERINERCDDLRKNASKSKEAKGCPYLTNDSVSTLRDSILVHTTDIEELVNRGKKMGACAYYASRRAIRAAHLVALPYQMLLHHSTREALGINLSNQVVIVDEAHNVMETLNDIYSVTITLAVIRAAQSQLEQYAEKYNTRLSLSNLRFVNQLLFVMRAMQRSVTGLPSTERAPGASAHLSSKSSASGAADEHSAVFTINDFARINNFDNINLFHLQNFCEQSEIAKKLHGFAERFCAPATLASSASMASEEGETTVLTTSTGREPVFQRNVSALQYVLRFLMSLANNDSDGRVIVTACRPPTSAEDASAVDARKSTLRFVMLNPGVHFRDVVGSARAVILAGGTMQPTDAFANQLLAPPSHPDLLVPVASASAASAQPFASVAAAPTSTSSTPETQVFSCGHIIPVENLQAVALAFGPTGEVKFDFSFRFRHDTRVMDELGRALCDIVAWVPEGVVCFFQSYDYMAKVLDRWRQTEVLQQVQLKKRVFQEPRVAGNVDSVLREYSECIRAGNGAILFCVVGGKLSEGINFSDGLGRCVVMVGLPFANMYSTELNEKMRYLNEQAKVRALASSKTNKLPPSFDETAAGEEFYLNLCMRAVNQSIGRAIRHSKDYATILLLDHRFLQPHIQAKLPRWIAESASFTSTEKFRVAAGRVLSFFAKKPAPPVH